MTADPPTDVEQEALDVAGSVALSNWPGRQVRDFLTDDELLRVVRAVIEVVRNSAGGRT
jgi:hypothetical protein